ncbi:hypothetical protein [Streptomyces sp. YGL11-2]|uniref:hypothetical protein n=1 Tax=Streptomyces sp. YGL11-2 TaxID=3414028 RepID=UPI003CF204EC
MLDKHIPLDHAEIIDCLGLTEARTERANKAVQDIVRTAWSRLPASQRPHSLEEYADHISAFDWALLFEACALSQAGRGAEACVLIAAARHFRAVHPNCN